jgi:nucleoside-diphosphate-sugar epimerase
MFLGAGQTVVRPGLVIGAGGMFGRHVKMIRTSRVIPLVDGGSDRVAIVALSDFSLAMTKIIETIGQPGWNLFNFREPTMREIVETVLQLTHGHARIVPVPYNVAACAVSAAEFLRLPLSFNSGSLRTMRLNRVKIHQSNLRDLIGSETDWETAVARSLELTEK